MAGHRPLAPARRSRIEGALIRPPHPGPPSIPNRKGRTQEALMNPSRTMRRLALGAVLLSGFNCLLLSAQAHVPQPPTGEELKQLAAQQHWADIVSLLEPVAARSANMDFYLGIALAQLGRFADAQHALEAGRLLAPNDPRFPVELAGVAFKQKNNAQAIRELRQALRLAPQDSNADAYANDFLGTVYYLQGNLEAALKYWNRAAKPEIAEVREEPPARVSPALLDNAFAFSPAATMTESEFLASNERLRALGIFPQFQIDLNARSDGKFDAVFRARELNGMGGTTLEKLLLFFQGLPFQEVNPQYDNFHRQAINFDSMFRWDAQKRRIFAQFSSPFERSAVNRWNLTADLRNENWAIRNGFEGPAPVLASFNMRHEAATAQIASIASDRFAWSAGAEVSHRDFRSVTPGTVLTPQMLAKGYQLKPFAQVSSTFWRVPERRFAMSADAAAAGAHLWYQPQQSFDKLTGSLGWHWLPQARGDDYETSQQLRAGKTFGQVPFDELFLLGLERDNDLPLRAHIGTRDGRKGSAPLGREYFLENWELNKNLYSNGLLQFQLGPLFDIGKIADPGTSLGSQKWLFDTGAQVKLRVLGMGLVFSYGKDLRTGNNAFYLSLIQSGNGSPDLPR
jgi:tetratricopeptide (TPR) repeat protein